MGRQTANVRMTASYVVVALVAFAICTLTWASSRHVTDLARSSRKDKRGSGVPICPRSFD